MKSGDDERSSWCLQLPHGGIGGSGGRGQCAALAAPIWWMLMNWSVVPVAGPVAGGWQQSARADHSCSMASESEVDACRCITVMYGWLRLSDLNQWSAEAH